MAFQLSLYERKHQSSDWLLGGVIYHVFVDRFFRGGNASPSEGALMLSDWENGIPEYPPYPGAPLKNNTFFGGDLDGIGDMPTPMQGVQDMGLYCEEMQKRGFSDALIADIFCGNAQAFFRRVL
jgi:microsomal dipeptidase-like Zn-dependent dipeptidase